MNPDFDKWNGLVPAVVQHALNRQILMVGFMNEQAWEKTLSDKKVTFYSRSRERLWTKGEESGHFLEVQSYAWDCDVDTVLILAIPQGSVCHTGEDTCFGSYSSEGFLYELENIIQERGSSLHESSYTRKLLHGSINQLIQKVGEEAVEVVIAAKDSSNERLIEESADLWFHHLVLLHRRGLSIKDVEMELKRRNQSTK